VDAVIPGLYATAPQALPFDRALEVRSFLLRRDQGNLLLYRADTLGVEGRALEDLGGIYRHYLNHRHEAMPPFDWVAGGLDPPLLCHEKEARSVADTTDVAETFSKRHRLDDDFEVIPTPGHTSGATAYLWEGGGHRCLFTGDTIYLREGEWVAAVLDGVSDREAYVDSLELIRGLDFDALVPWAASGDGPYVAFAEKSEIERRIDAILERLRRGEDH
jgi:glyoxylase-like metal-dependent hydrolase (beta-lactamase superfamily II)